MNKPLRLHDDLYIIDDYDLGYKERTGTYVLVDEKITIVETCASPSIPHLLEGLKNLDVRTEDIEYIIVTHIHLDHAGGAGLFLEKCPNAKVVVHPRGARHLADPTKLIAGAKAVYGKKFDDLFDPIVPIPEDRLVILHDGEHLRIGANHILTFYDTPGHANHHFSIFDSKYNGIFTGDTIGIYYQELKKDNIELYLPTTSPSQFDPEAMLTSAQRIQEMKVSEIYFGHFGVSNNVSEVFRQLNKWLPLFLQAGKQGLEVVLDDDFYNKTQSVKRHLFAAVSSYLDELQVSRDHYIYQILELDLEVCAMGIVDYFQKKGAL